MTENIIALQQEIERLQRTVDELRSVAVRDERPVTKLARWKDEIIFSLVPKEVALKGSKLQIAELRKNVTLVTNDIFYLTHEKRCAARSKMADDLFGYYDSEERISDYLDIFRRTCEFIAAQYKGHWKEMVEVPREYRITKDGRIYQGTALEYRSLGV